MRSESLFFGMILSQLTPHLIYQFKSESELLKAIQKLRDNFTTSREKIGEYLKDEKLVSAYTAFYLTTNFPKFAEVLEKIELSQEKLANFEIIDIGAGPGTFMLAQLENNPNQSVFGIESSPLMLEQANKLIKEFYPNSSAKVVGSTKAIAEKTKKRLGIFGHSANEMEPHQVLKLIKDLDLNEVLFIEPGTKSFFAKALDIRAELIGKGFNILYPCPGQSTCPMNGGEDWCHQFLYIKQHAEIERISQILKMDRKLLPQTIHYFSKQDTVSETSINRVVRVYKPTKFGLEMQVCHRVDSQNILFDFQQLSRNKSKKQMKELQKIFAGDKIAFTHLKNLENNKVRGDIQLTD